MKVVIYVTPLVAGVIMVFFMTKPLFAPRARKDRDRPYPLDPEVESELFSFIASICQTVGAPQPRQIELNCDLDAFGGLRPGFLSFFGHDLVLFVGLPLAGMVSVGELAGILAHEFGHFSQGASIRLYRVISTINNWFARVVFQRDAWDETLDQWRLNSEGFTMSFILACARLGVLLSRFILYLLCLLGTFISSSMSRQMEFNADAYAINLIGSAAYENFIRRLAVLQCAAKLSRGDQHGRHRGHVAPLSQSWPSCDERVIAARWGDPFGTAGTPSPNRRHSGSLFLRDAAHPAPRCDSTGATRSAAKP